MKLLEAMLVRAMRLFWNLVSFFFMGICYCALFVWGCAESLNARALGLAERAGERSDHWDDKLQKKRGP